PHVGVADEDLRHRAAPREFHHVRALLRVEVDPHFIDLRHAALAQQRLGPNAKGAHLRGVHAHWSHSCWPLRAHPTTKAPIVATDANPGLRRVMKTITP